MNENVFNLMIGILSDGGSLDWKRLSSYIEEHDLDINRIFDNYNELSDGEKFNFNSLVYSTLLVSINKFVDNYKLADAMRDRIYTNYLDSGIDLDVFEYCEEYELDISEEELIEIDKILRL